MPSKKKAVSTEESRAAAASAQNLPEGAVPEHRPVAAQQPVAGDEVSDLTKRLQEAGDPSIGVDEPMDQAAYDRAGSQSQMDKAAKDSKSEGPMVGNVVIATKGPHEGRVFAVTRVVSDSSVADLVRRLSGDPAMILNSPAELELTAIGDERDGERLILDVDENGLEKQNEAWRGTRAGRRH